MAAKNIRAYQDRQKLPGQGTPAADASARKRQNRKGMKIAKCGHMDPDAITSIDPYRRSIAGGAQAKAEAFSFSDALDIVNPLQHIPVVSWIYREISGDTIGAPASIAGGALFGGPIGFAAAIFSAAFESLSGESPEDFIADAIVPPAARQGIAAYGRAASLADG